MSWSSFARQGVRPREQSSTKLWREDEPRSVRERGQAVRLECRQELDQVFSWKCWEPLSNFEQREAFLKKSRPSYEGWNGAGEILEAGRYSQQICQERSAWTRTVVDREKNERCFGLGSWPDGGVEGKKRNLESNLASWLFEWMIPWIKTGGTQGGTGLAKAEMSCK